MEEPEEGQVRVQVVGPLLNLCTRVESPQMQVWRGERMLLQLNKHIAKQAGRSQNPHKCSAAEKAFVYTLGSASAGFTMGSGAPATVK